MILLDQNKIESFQALPILLALNYYSYINYSMNQKLWQAIGLQNKLPNILQQKLSEKHQHEYDLSLRASNSVSKIKPMPIHKNYNDISDEIYSCQSEIMDSKYEKSQAFSRNYLNKVHIQSLKRKICSIQDEFNSFRRDLQSLFFNFIQNTVYIIINNMQGLRLQHEREIQQLSKCQKCQSSKQVINNLTKQCWELQQRNNKNLQQINRLTQERIKSAKKQENTIKKIQNSLLQERGESIIKLKRQIQEISQQNQHLYIQLKNKEQQNKINEVKYKNSLISLKRQIQSINETYSNKIQRILIEKNQIQAKNEFYQLKCQQYEETLKKQIETRKRYYQRLVESSNNNSIQLQNPFPNSKHSKKSQKFLTMSSNDEDFRFQVNKNTGIDLKSAKSIHMYHQDESQQDTQRTSRQYIYARKASRNKYYAYNPTPKAKRYDESVHSIKNEGILSAKKFKTSQSSFDFALMKLNQIQKDVRRQINRSKISFK